MHGITKSFYKKMEDEDIPKLKNKDQQIAKTFKRKGRFPLHNIAQLYIETLPHH